MILLTKEYQKIEIGNSLSFNGVIGYLELWAKYNSNDSNANETNYSAQIRLVVSGGYIGNYTTTNCSLTATGIKSEPINLGSDSYTSRVLRTITGTVKHEDDGTKEVDMSGSINFSAWGMTLSVSGSAKLPDLHTPPSINSVNVTEKNSTLKNAGISNDTFVKWLSNKSFAFDVTTYDDAVINTYDVINCGISIIRGTSNPVNIDFANVNLYGNEQNKLTSFEFNVKDSKNGIATLSKDYTFIPYFKPTFINTDTKAKRQGQTSGKAILNASGSFYNSAIGTLSPICKVYLKHWDKMGTEPTAYTEIPSENITISENTFEIVDYLIGSAFDYKKSYYVKVYVQDGFYSSEPLILNIPVGEATWTEYKDRVDFKKATIQGKEVAIKENYSLEETKTDKTWIDGKPIYKKTFYSTSNEQNFNIPHGASIDTVVSIDGYYRMWNTTWFRLGCAYYLGNIEYLTALRVTGDNIEVSLGGWINRNSNMITHVTIEYTKTTDKATE